MDTEVLERSIRRATIREVECWLTVEFGRSPNLPMIRIAALESERVVAMDQIYRSMICYLLHWTLEVQGYYLTTEELSTILLRIARRYKKVGVARKRKKSKRSRTQRTKPTNESPPPPR